MAISTTRGSVPTDPAGTPLDTAVLDAALSDVGARVSSWAATGTFPRRAAMVSTA